MSPAMKMACDRTGQGCGSGRSCVEAGKRDLLRHGIFLARVAGALGFKGGPLLSGAHVSRQHVFFSFFTIFYGDNRQYEDGKREIS